MYILKNPPVISEELSVWEILLLIQHATFQCKALVDVGFIWKSVGQPAKSSFRFLRSIIINMIINHVTYKKPHKVK